MNRRGFLGVLGATAAGIAVGPEIAELLKPRKTIFLPPKGGWISGKHWSDVTIQVRGDELWVFSERTTELWTPIYEFIPGTINSRVTFEGVTGE